MIKPPLLGCPIGWTALARACSNRTDTDLLELLSKRADASGRPLRSIDQLGAFVTSLDEITTLGKMVERIRAKGYHLDAGPGGLSAYERHKERTRLRQAKNSALGRDIGPLPPIEDPERREACSKDLKLSLKTYWPDDFPLDWSENHLILIARAQLAILAGALFAVAMPRGEGKSTTIRAAVQWAINNRYSRFAYLIGATDEKAEESLDIITYDYESNVRLLADFPEICYPLWKLEGIHNRSKGQLQNGQRTRIKFGKKILCLPTIADMPGTGALIKGGGILSSIRGAVHRIGNELVRPDLVCPDDVQTRESAESPPQNATRLRILTSDVLGLAGPGKKISLLGTFTVVARGDMADTILDPDKHPEFRPLRTKMLISFPDRMDIWEEYWDIFRRALKAQQEAGADLEKLLKSKDDLFVPIEATRFYKRHRKEMDQGGKVAWEARKRPDELSALQSAMHLYFRNPEAFFSEYQNDPKDPNSDEEFLKASEIARKTNNYARGEVPLGVEWLTLFIDCHKRALVWMVMGWEWNFTGYIIDYGTFPESPRDRWRMQTFKPTLAMKFPKSGDEGALYQGLKVLGTELLTRKYRREDGAEMQIAKGLIDQGYQKGVVQRVIREQKWLNTMYPSFGKSFAPGSITIAEYRQRPGELLGDNWILRRTKGGRMRNVMFDVGEWKTFGHRRLSTEVGNAGCVTIFGYEPKSGKMPRRRANHDFLAEQLDGAVRTVVMDGIRAVQVWNDRPGTEVHQLDAYTGNCVLGSMCGARVAASHQVPKTATAKARSLAERRAEKRRQNRKVQNESD
ncbi:terminase gpA endonuclease subunit [Planctomicrobium sp. SH661]|uniref:terminase gpA endonuclease subunit n=1 Tax=Planctomicrobium sp. SH661 TaxID=3448124 RepID=UPI003F5B1CB7